MTTVGVIFLDRVPRDFADLPTGVHVTAQMIHIFRFIDSDTLCRCNYSDWGMYKFTERTVLGDLERGKMVGLIWAFLVTSVP